MSLTEALKIFREHGILPSFGDLRCPHAICGGNPLTFNDKENRWCCNKRFNSKKPKTKAVSTQCRFKISDRKGTILSHSKTPPWKILISIYRFGQKHFNMEQVSEDLNITISCCRRLKRKLEKVCVNFSKFQVPIGGQRIWVELDETVVCKRKPVPKGVTSVGRKIVLSTLWLLGGKERYGGGRFFIPLIKNVTVAEGETEQQVLERTAEILIPLINKFVVPGSNIITDGWKSYNKLSDFPKDVPEEQRFKHYTVNHSKEHVQEDDSAINKQHVGCLWKDLKSYIKKDGIRRQHI